MEGKYAFLLLMLKVKLYIYTKTSSKKNKDLISATFVGLHSMTSKFLLVLSLQNGSAETILENRLVHLML